MGIKTFFWIKLLYCYSMDVGDPDPHLKIKKTDVKLLIFCLFYLIIKPFLSSMALDVMVHLLLYVQEVLTHFIKYVTK